MSTIYDSSSQVGAPALAFVAGPQPGYATAPAPAFHRRELEDRRTQILAQAVGDHVLYELVLRSSEVAAQLARTL